MEHVRTQIKYSPALSFTLSLKSTISARLLRSGSDSASSYVPFGVLLHKSADVLNKVYVLKRSTKSVSA